MNTRQAREKCLNSNEVTEVRCKLVFFASPLDVEAVGNVLSQGPCNHPFGGDPGLPVVIPAAVRDLIFDVLSGWMHETCISRKGNRAMSSSCQALLAALKDCLLHSDCVLKQGNLPSQCLKEHADKLPEECQSLRKATFECKRGMVRYSSPK